MKEEHEKRKWCISLINNLRCTQLHYSVFPASNAALLQAYYAYMIMVMLYVASIYSFYIPKPKDEILTGIFDCSDSKSYTLNPFVFYLRINQPDQ
jgi:hypothetical protein